MAKEGSGSTNQRLAVANAPITVAMTRHALTAPRPSANLPRNGAAAATAKAVPAVIHAQALVPPSGITAVVKKTEKMKVA